MRSLRTILHKMDPNLSEGDESFATALALLASMEVGPNADKIAKRSGLSRSQSRKITTQCRDAGLFVKGKIQHGGWFDKKDGAIAFWLDVACVRGWLKRC